MIWEALDVRCAYGDTFDVVVTLLLKTMHSRHAPLCTHVYVLQPGVSQYRHDLSLVGAF
jgi:hypothetical protein